MAGVTKIHVALGERAYDVLAGASLLDDAAAHLAPYARGGRLVVVSDEQVWAALGERLTAALPGVALEPVIVPAGEESKSWRVLADLVERLLDLGVERGDHVLAFGGGMVGDLTGFAASIMKRGCGFVQIPTTLLAQVDSSVGGKTAINAAAGKNLVGTFHQPSLVLIDPAVLDTLPARELRAGYAEVAKYGLLGDAPFFAWCEENAPALLAGNVEARLRAIETSVRAKAEIVAEDEREAGRRALLNLGHSFAHALEAETGFSDRLLHGEAVAIGMVLAFRLSAGRGLCPAEDVERVEKHLRAVGLPVDPPEAGITDTAALAPHMRGDKKNEAGRPVLILARGIGQAYVEKSLSWGEVDAFLATSNP